MSCRCSAPSSMLQSTCSPRPCGAYLGTGMLDLALARGEARRCRLQFGDQRAHLARLEELAEAVVHRNGRRGAAATETLDGAQRELPVVARAPGLAAELTFELVEHGARAVECAGHVRADLDQVLAGGLQMEHVVEA